MAVVVVVVVLGRTRLGFHRASVEVVAAVVVAVVVVPQSSPVTVVVG